ncbi:MAG TPA: DNA alkylation repair protein [Patescibacteria group bacterium]|nr:DNA alkylation repair protein [Patescibacteria group bacterium]
MNKNEFHKIYKKFLNDNFNSERAVKEKAYLYSDLKHYGVGSNKRHEYYLKHKDFLLSLNKKEAIVFVKYLWNQPSFEEKTLALEILELHSNELNKSDLPLIEKMMRQSRGWALLDSLIIPLMPGILQKHKSVYEYLLKWIKDDDYWVRRSALLSQLLLFRSGKGGRKDLFFQMAQSQFDELWIDKIYKGTLVNKRAKFFIRKAIGWTLRDMSAKSPETVYNFLKNNKNKMSGLSFREGSRKLPPKLRSKLSDLK